MAVSYAGKTLIRPARDRYPLILRNQQDIPGRHDTTKRGPMALLKFGPHDYRMWFEAVTAVTGAVLTNFMKYAESGNPWTWKVSPDADDIFPLGLSTWEKGEVCPTCWWYDEHDDLFKMLYHGGNNAGPRQVGLMTAPRTSEGKPGGWTRYGTSPVLTNGGSGAWDEDDVADVCAIHRLAADNYKILYRGVRVSDGKSQIGLATSTDRGYTWTKYGSNPVMALGSGNDVNEASAPWSFRDELGRWHAWYVGKDATDVMRVLYGFSDDDGQTWTRNPAQVAIAPGGATDPDNGVGDVMSGLVDEGLVLVQCLNFNFSGFPDGRGRLEGRGQYWLPCEAATQPARPGRAFTSAVANSRVTVNAAAKLLNSTVWTIWSDFKIPPAALYREIYTEYAAFNKEVFLRVSNNGRIEFEFRTPTAQVLITGRSSKRFDNGQLHRVMAVRRAAADFELYADGVSIGTSATNPSTDATAMAVCWGNWDPAIGADEPAMGILRQSLTIQGRALTAAEELDLWNDGKDGGVLPAGVTATCWVKHGSGGAAGPDAAYGGATYGTTVVAGTVLVNGERTAPLLPRTVIPRPLSLRI